MRHKRRYRHANRLGVLMPGLIATMATWCDPVRGQTTRQREPEAFVNRQRALDMEARRSLDAQQLRAPRGFFDWGGWYSSHIFLFDDGVESSRTLRRHDLRLWGRLQPDDGIHELYARVRLSLLDFNAGDSYDGNDDDVEGPNLERGTYRFDLGRAIEVGSGAPPEVGMVFKAGRDLVQFGEGVALAAPLDHVSLTANYRDFELIALGGRTVGSMEDFDLSRTASRTRRSFLGGQLRYLGFERHEPFVYVFWQRDRNRERTFRPLQRFEYDSFYFGIGSRGELATRLRYATEWVYETGHSFGDHRFLIDNDIEAWAILAELEYLFPGEHHGRTSVEYVFGSGDADRLQSPTNSIGGNRNDRLDTGFVAFGFRDTGLSFAPRYSNLHLWRAGGSYFPWPNDRRFRNFQVGTDWYVFYKHHRTAAVSDPTADVPSGYLGWEMDYYLNWQVDADLAWTARLGVFFPGSAFSDRTTRTFLLVGLTWSF